MNANQRPGQFEQVVLLAILRLEHRGAYGVSIQGEIADYTERRPTPGAIYTTLDRLEHKGFVSSSLGEATAERGGRAKRYYRVTPKGRKNLRRAQAEIRTLSQGLDIYGETYA